MNDIHIKFDNPSPLTFDDLTDGLDPLQAIKREILKIHAPKLKDLIQSAVKEIDDTPAESHLNHNHLSEVDTQLTSLLITGKLYLELINELIATVRYGETKMTPEVKEALTEDLDAEIHSRKRREDIRHWEGIEAELNHQDDINTG